MRMRRTASVADTIIGGAAGPPGPVRRRPNGLAAAAQQREKSHTITASHHSAPAGPRCQRIRNKPSRKEVVVWNTGDGGDGCVHRSAPPCCRPLARACRSSPAWGARAPSVRCAVREPRRGTCVRARPIRLMRGVVARLRVPRQLALAVKRHVAHASCSPGRADLPLGAGNRKRRKPPRSSRRKSSKSNYWSIIF